MTQPQRSSDVDRIVTFGCLAQRKNYVEADRVFAGKPRFWLIEDERTVRFAHVAVISLIVPREAGKFLALFDHEGAVLWRFHNAHVRYAG